MRPFADESKGDWNIFQSPFFFGSPRMAPSPFCLDVLGTVQDTFIRFHIRIQDAGGVLMGTGSAIEWTDSTWNPVTGCTKVSPSCAHCYAERLAKRLRAMGQPNNAKGFDLALHENCLDLPFRWKKPQNIFVNSMSDLFHREVPDEFIMKDIRGHEESPLACLPGSHQAFGETQGIERIAPLGPEHLDGGERGVPGVHVPDWSSPRNRRTLSSSSPWNRSWGLWPTSI